MASTPCSFHDTLNTNPALLRAEGPVALVAPAALGLATHSSGTDPETLVASDLWRLKDLLGFERARLLRASIA